VVQDEKEDIINAKKRAKKHIKKVKGVLTKDAIKAYFSLIRKYMKKYYTHNIIKWLKKHIINYLKPI
jgi:cyclopropane fatty-acyl-phospholipid synthase-like methyltransferase